MAETGETPAKDVCNVCHDDIEIYAVGKCEHFVCYKCSTRMRLLCEQMYCAICRADLPEVLFMTKYRKYEDAVGLFKLCHKNQNIYFENEKARNAFLDLLSHKCKLCPLLQPMKTFRELQQHMRRDHGLHYCDICVKDLKVFTAERKFYTREELARHRRLGDVDDKSFKGHPLCELCDQRYLDRDELARHCRKEHYYCHFCESDGLPLVFFGDYSILKDHFKEEHFLCEEGDCIRAQFTNAFRSEIDLKAHKASEHSRHMNKAEIRQARTIEVDFQLAPRHGSNRGRGGRNRGRNRDFAQDRATEAKHDDGDENQDNKDQRNHARYQREQYETAQLVAQHLNEIHRHSGAVAMVDRAILNPVSFEEARQENAPNKQTFSQMPEDFPVLGKRSDENTSASGEETSKTVSSKKDTLAKKLALGSNLSVKDDDMENGDFPSLSGSASGKKSQAAPYKSAWHTQPKSADFPALSSNKQSNGRAQSSGQHMGARAGSVPVITGGTWVQSSQPPANTKKSENRSNKQTRVPSADDFPSLHSIGNMLLNMTPAAPGLSLTKLSSSTLPVTSAGVGHGQPIPSKVPERPKPAANFTTDDFPALGGKKDFSGLPNSQVSSKPKEANYFDAQERKPSKPPRQNGKQPAPMPEFESSASESMQGKQEAEKSEQDEKWEVVKPQKSFHSAVDGKLTNYMKSKKKAKKNKKKSLEDKSNKTIDFTKSDSDEVTQKVDTSSKDCKKSRALMDMGDMTQDEQHKPERNEDSEGNDAVSDSNRIEYRVQNKVQNDLGSSHKITLPADADMKQTEVNNFPSLSELSETTNILPTLSATDEFPSLPSGKKSLAPPGFSKTKHVSGPPPGFVKSGSCMASSKPPPGFGGPLIHDIENIAPLIGGSSSYTSYIEPNNFRSRNEKLIGDIREMLSDDKFNEFRSCSGEFRRGHMTAREYYNKCRSIMGSEQFSTILPELISLLPDIERQQELLVVYSDNDDEMKSCDSVQKKQKRKSAWKSQTMLLAPCTICRQVVLSSELNEHVSKHDVYMDFPTLSSISASLIHP